MKKELNNKGFTLVELLAVVVILLAISTVAITSISASIDRQNAKKDEATKKIIVSYGKLYLEERVNTGDICVNISELRDKYSLDETTMKKSDGTLFGGSVIYDKNDKKYKYQVIGCN